MCLDDQLEYTLPAHVNEKLISHQSAAPFSVCRMINSNPSWGSSPGSVPIDVSSEFLLISTSIHLLVDSPWGSSPVRKACFVRVSDLI